MNLTNVQNKLVSLLQGSAFCGSKNTERSFNSEFKATTTGQRRLESDQK